MTEEIWVNVVGWEGFYLVSNLGRVKSVSRTVIHKDGKKTNIKERILKSGIDNNGYEKVVLCRECKMHTRPVHRLVAEAFILNPDNKNEVNHINSIRSDNNLCNLEWVTERENSIHGYKHGNHKRYSGVNSFNRREILVLDDDLSVIRKYDTLRIAAKDVGVSEGTLSEICSKNKRWRGNIWIQSKNYEIYLKNNNRIFVAI